MDSENWKCGPPLRGFPISCFRDLPKKLAESEPGRVLASHMSDLVSHRGKTSEASGPKDQCNVHRVFVCRAIQLRADFLKLTETEGSRFFVACNISSHRVVLHSQSSYLIQKLIVEGRPTGVQDGVRGMLEHAYRTGCSLLLSYCVPFAGGNDDCYWDLSVLKTGPQDDQEARKPVLGISSDNLDVNWRDDRGFEFSLRDGVKERIKVYTEEFARTSTVIDLDTPAQSDAPRVENEGACKLAATNKKLKGLVDALVKQRKSIVEQLNSNEQQRKEDAMERQRLQVQESVYKTEIKILETECTTHDAEMKASAIAVELALSSNSERLATLLQKNRNLEANARLERHRIQERSKTSNEVIAELRSQLDLAKAQVRHEADAHRAESERKLSRTTKELRRLESECILLRESHRIAQKSAASEKKRVRDLAKELQNQRTKNASPVQAGDPAAAGTNASECEFARVDQARRIMNLTRQSGILLSLVTDTAREILSDPLNIGLYSTSC